MSRVFPTLGEPLTERWQLEWKGLVTEDWCPCTPETELDVVMENYVKHFRQDVDSSVGIQYRIVNKETGEIIPCEIVQH